MKIKYITWMDVRGKAESTKEAVEDNQWKIIIKRECYVKI